MSQFQNMKEMKIKNLMKLRERSFKYNNTQAHEKRLCEFSRYKNKRMIQSIKEDLSDFST